MMKWFAPDAFNAFTDEQWQAYQSICRKWPQPIDWNEARRQLAQGGPKKAFLTQEKLVGPALAPAR